MPTSARQMLITANKKKGNTKGAILIIKKTGYVNVFVNNNRLYYNASQTNIPMSSKNITKQFISKGSPSKKTIIITRKSG